MKLTPYIFSLIIISLAFTSCEQNRTSTQSARTKNTIKKVSVPRFNADSAYTYVDKQVSFGPRVPETDAHSACGAWLVGKLNQYCDTVIVQKFKARTYDKVTRTGKNIIASFQPDNPRRILLMSHWDSRPFADQDPDIAKQKLPVDGANDGGSGVGILLEVARQLAKTQSKVGVDIVLFDLEDWGPPSQLNLYKDEYWGLGAQYWAGSPHVYGYEATFGILLDMVGTDNPSFRKEYFSKQYARYVLDMVWSTAADLGYGEYFLDEDGSAINDDHVHINRIAQIPTIDIIHLKPQNAATSFFDQWHTASDNMDHVNKNSLGMVGQVLLTVIYNE